VLSPTANSAKRAPYLEASKRRNLNYLFPGQGREAPKKEYVNAGSHESRGLWTQNRTSIRPFKRLTAL
jgi:hypothetical protein